MLSTGRATCSTVLDILQVPDVVRVELRRSVRLSKLRASASA